MNQDKIPVIAVTGGPCGGKSKAVKRIKEWLEPLGYTVYVLSEVATDIFGTGIRKG